MSEQKKSDERKPKRKVILIETARAANNSQVHAIENCFSVENVGNCTAIMDQLDCSEDIQNREFKRRDTPKVILQARIQPHIFTLMHESLVG